MTFEIVILFMVFAIYFYLLYWHNREPSPARPLIGRPVEYRAHLMRESAKSSELITVINADNPRNLSEVWLEGTFHGWILQPTGRDQHHIKNLACSWAVILLKDGTILTILSPDDIRFTDGKGGRS